MARKKKEFNKDGTFQTRFRAKFNESGETQESMAKTLGVSRPTLVSWLDGKNLPDILSLEKIARYYGVSADYLLGLSNTESPDVSVRAAAEYTGLSEAAVKCLHNGIDDYWWDTKGAYDKEKKENLLVASNLIVSRGFSNAIGHLRKTVKEAYWDKCLMILLEQYSGDFSQQDKAPFNYDPTKAADFYYTDENRSVVKAAIASVLGSKLSPWKADIPQMLHEMDDNALHAVVFEEQLKAHQENELQQFHAAKAFTGYIDQLVKESHERAAQRFEKK